MPKYLIERRFHVSEGEMPRVSTDSKRKIQEHFPGIIVWEHSQWSLTPRDA